MRLTRRARPQSRAGSSSSRQRRSRRAQWKAQSSATGDPFSPFRCHCEPLELFRKPRLPEAVMPGLTEGSEQRYEYIPYIVESTLQDASARGACLFPSSSPCILAGDAHLVELPCPYC